MHFPPPPHPPRAPTPPPYVPYSPRRETPKKNWGLRVGLVVGLLAGVGGAATFGKVRYFPNTPVLPGVSIDGERIPDKADPAKVHALAESRAKALLARKVALKLPDHDKAVLEVSLEELGMRVDLDRTTAAAMNIGKDGDLLTRAYAARDARDGKIDVPLFTHIDENVALTRLQILKETEDTQPVSARLDLDKHETIPEKEGRYIDAHETIALLEGLPKDRRADSLTLPVRSFAPRVSSAFLKSLDISTVVAEYETFFSRVGDQTKRGKNIDNAAQKLDGIVISPGELMSFNEVIGERSESNGFEKSWEIFKGEMVEGVGGGTCQVASTFHAATFFAGFDVLERLPHSRPSAYIPMGLDSTVVFPAVDLKVRNPHPFPVVVHAKTGGGKLRIELLGKMKPVKVGFGREVVATLPYKRKIEEDAALSGKKVIVKQHGIRGYKIKRSRLFTYPDGTHKKEEMTDTYPPTTEIYKVPIGFDVALLPPLPDENGDVDPDLGGNPSPAPAAAKSPSSSGSDASASSSSSSSSAGDVEFVDAPGAHAPTAAQRDAAKTIWMKR